MVQGPERERLEGALRTQVLAARVLADVLAVDVGMNVALVGAGAERARDGAGEAIDHGDAPCPGRAGTRPREEDRLARKKSTSWIGIGNPGVDLSDVPHTANVLLGASCPARRAPSYAGRPGAAGLGRGRVVARSLRYEEPWTTRDP